jgi:hypothetical protein
MGTALRRDQTVDDYRVAAGDPFVAAGRRSGMERIDEVVRRTYPDLLTAIREEQAHIGRHMTDSELDEFARRYYADEYRQDLRRIMSMGVEEPDEEE